MCCFVNLLPIYLFLLLAPMPLLLLLLMLSDIAEYFAIVGAYDKLQSSKPLEVTSEASR